MERIKEYLKAPVTNKSRLSASFHLGWGTGFIAVFYAVALLISGLVLLVVGLFTKPNSDHSKKHSMNGMLFKQ